MSDVFSLTVISIVFAVIGFLYGLFIKGSLSKAILYGVLGLILPLLLIILLILMTFRWSTGIGNTIDHGVPLPHIHRKYILESFQSTRVVCYTRSLQYRRNSLIRIMILV